MWQRELRKLFACESEMAILPFMDGPYEMRLRIVDDSCVHVQCIVRRMTDDIVLLQTLCYTVDIKREIESAAEVLIDFMRRNDIWNKDCDALQHEIVKYRS